VAIREVREKYLMSRIRLGTVGLVCIALGVCGAARAADAGKGWERLQQLHPGDRVRVELSNDEVAGTFRAVTEDGLELARGQAGQGVIRRTEIRRVYLKRSAGRSAAGLIGVGTGAGVGFAIGWSVGDPPGCRPFAGIPCIYKPASGAIVAAVGAVLGGLVGHFVGKEKLVYKAH
jgi:hypothetical protein